MDALARDHPPTLGELHHPVRGFQPPADRFGFRPGDAPEQHQRQAVYLNEVGKVLIQRRGCRSPL